MSSKKVNNPGFAWLHPTESLSLLLDCPLAEGVASVRQKSDPINEDFLCLGREKLLADVSLLRGNVCALKTIANSVVRKINTSASLDFANDIRDVRLGLGAKLGACLLDELFNVSADRTSSRKHAPCTIGRLIVSPSCHSTSRAK
jgi:hypothetical protein